MKSRRHPKHKRPDHLREKSTVDYYGISQGRGIAFDAKAPKKRKIRSENVHDHQVQYLDHFLKQGGIAFLLIEFARLREFYL
ncbi:Holliday junction resolvase RecU [Bacillus licheniformis]|nr:Holliday junction resolvase RecU [Bacillus licheniformis]